MMQRSLTPWVSARMLAKKIVRVIRQPLRLRRYGRSRELLRPLPPHFQRRHPVQIEDDVSLLEVIHYKCIDPAKVQLYL
jgi:hypothetical protein